MMCPILSSHPDAPVTRCDKENCAMWDFERECCGLRVLSLTEARALLRVDD